MPLLFFTVAGTVMRYSAPAVSALAMGMDTDLPSVKSTAEAFVRMFAPPAAVARVTPPNEVISIACEKVTTTFVAFVGIPDEPALGDVPSTLGGTVGVRTNPDVGVKVSS